MAATKTCPKCGAELAPNALAGICPRCLMQLGLGGQATANHHPSANASFTPDDRSAVTIPPPTKFATPYLERLAQQFPQLEILEHLGQGGMGVVYKARQRHLNRLVAVKILPPSIGDEPAFAERFTREAQALAQLNHPHIVQVYDFGRTDEFFYFIMEFVDGANLRALMRDGTLDPEQALKIVPQICDALQFAHDEGIVHRDIKPENILIDKKGRVKIADFGLAKLLGRAAEELSLTGTGQLMGTLGYMAPEQLQEAHTVDHRADIYSLGVVFYEMLTGKLPIGRFDPPSKKVHVDVRLDEVVLRSLESEPDRRYQHASEIKEQVDRITSMNAPHAAPPSYEHVQYAAGAGPEYPSGHSMNWFVGLDPKMGQQIVQAAAKLLGVAAVLLFISAGFHLFNREYAIFGGIASILLAGLVKSTGRKLFPVDRDSLIADNVKLQTALAMSAGPQRDQVLIKVAREAVDEGESKVAELAIEAIQDAKARDEAATSCALGLAKNEGVEAALPVARLIQENDRRNGVFEKLAGM
jgi:serine/threonine protein kinase